MTMVNGIAALLTLALVPDAQSVNKPAPAETFESLARQAEEAREAKELEKALAMYRRALKLRPNWEDGWWNTGNIAYDLDKYEECATDFRRLSALKPDLAPAWTLRGLCEYKLRDYSAALQSLTRVQRLKFPGDRELSGTARLHLALVLIKLGHFERAIQLLFDVAAIEQSNTEIIVAAGIAGLRRNWIPPEVPESDRDRVYKLGDAMAAVMRRDYKVATERFEAALRDYPQDPDFHYRFGSFLMWNYPDRGIEEIKRALELEPEHVPALLALAKIYLKRDESQAALPYAEKAAKLSPGDFYAHAALGNVLLATADTARAVQELELSVKLAPENPEAHYNLATAYNRVGRTKDAVRERMEAKRLRDAAVNQP